MKDFEKIIKKYDNIERKYKKIKEKYKNVLKNPEKLKKYKKLIIEYESIKAWFQIGIDVLQRMDKFKSHQIYKRDKLYLRIYKRLVKKLSSVAMICDYCGEPKSLIEFVYSDINYLNQYCLDCYLLDMQDSTGFPYYSDYIRYKMGGVE